MCETGRGSTKPVFRVKYIKHLENYQAFRYVCRELHGCLDSVNRDTSHPHPYMRVSRPYLSRKNKIERSEKYECIGAGRSLKKEKVKPRVQNGETGLCISLKLPSAGLGFCSMWRAEGEDLKMADGAMDNYPSSPLPLHHPGSIVKRKGLGISDVEHRKKRSGAKP